MSSMTEKRKAGAMSLPPVFSGMLLAGFLGGRFPGRGLLLGGSRSGAGLVQLLHEAPLAAGSIAGMDGALLRGPVEGTNGSQDRLVRCGAFGQRGMRGLDGSPGGAAEVAIAQAALLVLTIPFDLGLDICQGRSSKDDFYGLYRVTPGFLLSEPLKCSAVLYMKQVFLSSIGLGLKKNIWPGLDTAEVHRLLDQQRLRWSSRQRFMLPYRDHR